MPFDSATYQTAETDLPSFKPRRNRGRLDFRPVIWSLRNRPHEWGWAHQGYTLEHKPTRHTFWIATGRFDVALRDARGCSCGNLEKPPLIDRLRFWSAFQAWRRHGSDEINRQFAAHFITPSTKR